MSLTSILASACFATLCLARLLPVKEMLNIEPGTCLRRDRDLDMIFRNTWSLYDDCNDNYDALLKGLEEVEDDGWQRNIAKTAWWSWNVQDISDSRSKYREVDLIQLGRAHVQLGKGMRFLTEPRHEGWKKTRTICSEGYWKAIFAGQVDDEAAMVLTIAGYDDEGLTEAIWVPRKRGSWPFLPTSLKSKDVCEGDLVRVLKKPDQLDPQLILCDELFSKTAHLDAETPPGQITAPASSDSIQNRWFASSRMIYATQHLMSPDQCQDPDMYMVKNGRKLRLDNRDPVAIAVMNLAPLRLMFRSPLGEPEDEPDPVFNPHVHETFCLLSYWEQEGWDVPPRGSSAARWIEDPPSDSEESGAELMIASEMSAQKQEYIENWIADVASWTDRLSLQDDEGT